MFYIYVQNPQTIKRFYSCYEEFNSFGTLVHIQRHTTRHISGFNNKWNKPVRNKLHLGNLKSDHATEWILKQNTTYLCTDRIELVLEAGLNLPTPTNGSEDPRCILLLKSAVIELTSKPSSCRRSSSLKQKHKNCQINS